jgi:WhiB family transcriptional regulator, redox-sensing transcriptional regulator
MRTPARVPFTVDTTPWRGQAACRRENATVFFPPAHFEMKPEKDAREGQARSLCRQCPVQQDCLDYSLLVQEPHGIWGGLNELERRRLIRKRALTQRSA